MTGGVVSRTVTVKLAVDVLPFASRAVAVTVVAPSANVEPLTLSYLISTGPNRSFAVAENVTAAPAADVASAMTSATESTGGVVSRTVTVKLAFNVFPFASRAVAVTIVAPSANVEPLSAVVGDRHRAEQVVAVAGT